MANFYSSLYKLLKYNRLLNNTYHHSFFFGEYNKKIFN